jgi:hypothetical protein
MSDKLDATTPLVEPKTATPTLPMSADGPNTYEDCLQIIAGLESESSSDNLKAGIKKLSHFFNKRVGKKKGEDDRDGGGAVKRALSSNRNFKKYESKPIAQEAAKSPFA